jgi:hypothetical protein
MLKWEGHVSLTGKGRDICKVVVGKPEVHHLEDLSLDGRVILK